MLGHLLIGVGDLNQGGLVERAGPDLKGGGGPQGGMQSHGDDNAWGSSCWQQALREVTCKKCDKLCEARRDVSRMCYLPDCWSSSRWQQSLLDVTYKICRTLSHKD